MIMTDLPPVGVEKFLEQESCAGFGSRGGDSVRTDWTKDGPAGPDAIGSPWALTGGDSGVGTALHGTPP